VRFYPNDALAKRPQIQIPDVVKQLRSKKSWIRARLEQVSWNYLAE